MTTESVAERFLLALLAALACAYCAGLTLLMSILFSSIEGGTQHALHNGHAFLVILGMGVIFVLTLAAMAFGMLAVVFGFVTFHEASAGLAALGRRSSRRITGVFR